MCEVLMNQNFKTVAINADDKAKLIYIATAERRALSTVLGMLIARRWSELQKMGVIKE